jgi:hypothetical protein
LPCISDVLGCISYYGEGTLVLVERNMKTEKYISVVDDNIWPLTAIQISNWSWIFQEYNALCHVSAGPISRNWNMISTLFHTQSPDLNIIENI